jgi:hypothetical protein
VRGDGLPAIPPSCSGTTSYNGVTLLTGNTTVVYESRDPTIFMTRFMNDTNPFRTYGACGGGYVIHPVMVQLFAVATSMLIFGGEQGLTLETVFDFFDFELACARGEDVVPIVLPLMGDEPLVCNTTTGTSGDYGTTSMTVMAPGTSGVCTELPGVRVDANNTWSAQSYFRCAALEIDVATVTPTGSPTDCGDLEAAADACLPLYDELGPYGNCFDDLPPKEYYESCVVNYCALADPGLVCLMLKAYETQCAFMGEWNYTSVADACGVCGGNGSTCVSTTLGPMWTEDGEVFHMDEDKKTLGGGAIAGIVVGSVVGVAAVVMGYGWMRRGRGRVVSEGSLL